MNVYAKVSGYIQKLYVDWGTHVSKGQILAVLEIPELQQQIDLDEAAVRRSGPDAREEELNQAKSKYEVTDLTYKRLASVMQTRPGLIAQEDVDVASGKDLEARAGVSGATAAVASGTGIGHRESGARKRQSHVCVCADHGPVQRGGYPNRRLHRCVASSGNVLEQGDQALCHLSQNDLLRLVIPVPERAVDDIRVGETVGVQVRPTTRHFKEKLRGSPGRSIHKRARCTPK